MKTKLIIKALLLIIAMPLFTKAQYYTRVFDIDSSSDWGRDIFIEPDSSYFIVGDLDKGVGVGLITLHISNDGNQVIDKTITHNNNCSYFNGFSGRVKKMINGNYLLPITVEWPKFHHDPAQAAGIAILDKNGDTLLVRTYTDTARYMEVAYDAISYPDGGYLFTGKRTDTGAAPYDASALLIRTDSMGNKLWERTYSFITTNNIKSVQLLDNGKLLLGGEYVRLRIIPGGQGFFYWRRRARFILADSADGNILYDTLTSFSCAGNTVGSNSIFKDKNGGYFFWGTKDTVETINPSSFSNFPDYLLHFDDQFRLTWRKDYPYSLVDGHRRIASVKQTMDNGYLLVGTRDIVILNGDFYVFGWASKLDQNGNTIWEQTYVKDSTQQAYLDDGVEKPGGGFVFTGNTRDNSLPAWRNYDVWLLSVDSNGCLVPGCDPHPLAVPAVPVYERAGLSVYPNPNNGNFTINSEDAGEFFVYSVDGRLVKKYMLGKGKTSILLPETITPGVYIGKFSTNTGNKMHIIRLVYKE